MVGCAGVRQDVPAEDEREGGLQEEAGLADQGPQDTRLVQTSKNWWKKCWYSSKLSI